MPRLSTMAAAFCCCQKMRFCCCQKMRWNESCGSPRNSRLSSSTMMLWMSVVVSVSRDKSLLAVMSAILDRSRCMRLCCERPSLRVSNRSFLRPILHIVWQKAHFITAFFHSYTQSTTMIYIFKTVSWTNTPKASLNRAESLLSRKNTTHFQIYCTGTVRVKKTFTYRCVETASQRYNG